MEGVLKVGRFSFYLFSAFDRWGDDNAKNLITMVTVILLDYGNCS